MSSIIKNITLPLLLALLVTTIVACNKENLNAEKAHHVLINGYNGGSNNLQVSIDTTAYTANSFIAKPSSVISFNAVYTYRLNKERFVTITDVVNKKVLFSKPLPATGTKVNFNFIYVDGSEVPVNPPAADPATNKLGFYVHYSEDNEPFDIFLYRKDETTGEEYRQYLAKNVTPKTWIFVDYIPTANFATRNLLDKSSIVFTKTGTTDQWAFQKSEAMSSISSAGAGFPTAGEKGLVLPYFFINGSIKLEYSRLYFYLDRF